MESKQIKCPTCGKLTNYSPENIFRPFCSDRCRLLDLGAWASEEYKVPSRETIHIDVDNFVESALENENTSMAQKKN